MSLDHQLESLDNLPVGDIEQGDAGGVIEVFANEEESGAQETSQDVLQPLNAGAEETEHDNAVSASAMPDVEAPICDEEEVVVPETFSNEERLESYASEVSEDDHSVDDSSEHYYSVAGSEHAQEVEGIVVHEVDEDNYEAEMEYYCNEEMPEDESHSSFSSSSFSSPSHDHKDQSSTCLESMSFTDDSAKRTAATVATMKPVMAEPLDESMRDIPTISISRRDEQRDPPRPPRTLAVKSSKRSVSPLRQSGAKGTDLNLLDEKQKIKHRDAVLTEVKATPIQEPSSRDSMHFEDDEEDGRPVFSRRLAQFISARIIRGPNRSLGFRIRTDEESNNIVITEVKEDGCLSQTPIVSGDKLISIDNQSCLGMRFQGVQTLLEHAGDQVTLTVQDPRGNGSLVECYVMKPHPHASLGIDLVDHVPSHAILATSRPVIASVDPQGLFGDSLLNPGDRIVSVNGKPVKDVASAKAILKKAYNPHITIMAKSKSKTAAVVTTEPEFGTRSRVFDMYGIPAQAMRLRRRGEGSSPQDSARGACNAIAIANAIMAVLFPDQVGMFSSSRNWIVSIIFIFALVNMPWFFRKEGERFSRGQAFTNALLVAWMLYALFGSSNGIAAGWFCAFYLPLMVLINVPILFPYKSPGSSGEENREVEEEYGDTEHPITSL